MEQLGQEKEYSPDHFKRQRVFLGSPSNAPLTTTVAQYYDNLFLQSEVFKLARSTEASEVVSLGLEKIFDVMASNAMWLNSVANQAKGVFKTWPFEKQKYEEDHQRLIEKLGKKDALILQLEEENINLAMKCEGEKAELTAQLESSKKACENAKALLKDAQKSLEEYHKKNSNLEKPKKTLHTCYQFRKLLFQAKSFYHETSRACISTQPLFLTSSFSN